MVMMLPFLLASIAIFLGIRGRRGPCLWAWVATFVVYLAWLNYHMTDALPISL